MKNSVYMYTHVRYLVSSFKKKLRSLLHPSGSCTPANQRIDTKHESSHQKLHTCTTCTPKLQVHVLVVCMLYVYNRTCSVCSTRVHVCVVPSTSTHTYTTYIHVHIYYVQVYSNTCTPLHVYTGT